MSPTLKKRIRVYAFAAGIVVAIMAGIPPLDEVSWPQVVIVVLGLTVGVLNISGEDQIERFIIAAIGLKVTSAAFLDFSPIGDGPKAIIINLEIFITAGLLFVALKRIYETFREKFKNYEVWFYIAAIVLVLLVWIFGGDIEASLITYAAVGLIVLGLIAGYFEGPKNPDQAIAQRGRRFLIAAVALQLSSSAIMEIDEVDYPDFDALLGSIKTLLENLTIFTTSALLMIAFMAIFWVLDEVQDQPAPPTSPG